MAYRFERHRAKTLRLWTMICRLASIFKAQDDKAGRKSWKDPEKIIKNNMALHIEILPQWKRKKS